MLTGGLAGRGRRGAGWSTEDLAINLADLLFGEDPGDYWFLDRDLDEKERDQFIAAINDNLKANDINPEKEGEMRSSYRERDTGGQY